MGSDDGRSRWAGSHHLMHYCCIFLKGGAAGAAQADLAQVSRSGNVWGVDETQLAADLARKVQVSAQAETQTQAQERADGGGRRHQSGSLLNPGAAPVPSSSSSVVAVPGPGSGKELSLKGVGLVQVPAEVWQAAPWLSKLDLSGNRNLNGDFQQASVCTRFAGKQSLPYSLPHHYPP